jgi:hypothetical protein
MSWLAPPRIPSISDSGDGPLEPGVGKRCARRRPGRLDASDELAGHSARSVDDLDHRGGSSAVERDLRPIGRPGRVAVERAGVESPDIAGRYVDDVQLACAHERDLGALGRPRRRVVAAPSGDWLQAATVGVDHVDMAVTRGRPNESYLRPVGRPRRLVVGPLARDRMQLRPVRANRANRPAEDDALTLAAAHANGQQPVAPGTTAEETGAAITNTTKPTATARAIRCFTIATYAHCREESSTAEPVVVCADNRRF